MSSYAVVVVLVEGQTEQRFVKDLLAPHMAPKGVYLTAIILTKPGQKGGDVKFARAQNDIGTHLKQRSDTWITLMVDYYGIRADWPGYAESKRQADHERKANVMNRATAEKVSGLFQDQDGERRFIPYVSMHELEALYFSDPASVAQTMEVSKSDVEAILTECGEPERINDNATTAPSKRLSALSARFKKTATGLEIAKKIGIPKMRSACPLFHAWLEKLEALVRQQALPPESADDRDPS